MAHEVEFGADDEGVVVAHMDLDGGEEPAVTTDVMLSGNCIIKILIDKFELVY